MSHNLIVPFKFSRGTNLFPCQGKEKLGVALGRAHGVSYRSFKIPTVQFSYSGKLTADDAGLLKSIMEVVLSQTTVRTTKFLMYLIGHLSEGKLNAPEAHRN